MLKASKDTIKYINKQNILNFFIGKDLVTKADIVEQTNLSPATVSSLISELVTEGLVLEKKIGESSGGRKPMLYTLNGELAYVLSIRITPKGAMVGIVNLKCSIVYSKTVVMTVHGEKSLKELLAQVINDISSMRGELLQAISAIAISTPGVLDFTGCRIIYSSTLYLDNINISELVSEVFPYPIKTYLFKDTDALILGEYYFSKYAYQPNMAYILCENGVGMSLVSKGHLFKQDGCGLELGHQTIDIHGEKCKCSMKGCIGTMLSEIPAVKRYLELYERSHDGFFDLGSLNYDDIVNLYEEGDAIAVEVIGEQLEYLSVAAVNVVNLFNPDVLIIGGSLARLEKELADVVECKVKKTALKPFTQKLSICGSKLGLGSSLLGMANQVLKVEFFKSVSI